MITQHRVRTLLPDCHIPPSQHFKLQPEIHASDHLSTDWKLWDPTVDLINLLEWFKELRETFYLQDFLFIIKGYKYGTARWKKTQKAKWGKRTMSFHIIFRRYQSSQISRYSHTLKLVKPHPSVIFMEALLLKHNWFNHWPLVTELNAGVREVTFKVPRH